MEALRIRRESSVPCAGRGDDGELDPAAPVGRVVEHGGVPEARPGGDHRHGEGCGGEGERQEREEPSPPSPTEQGEHEDDGDRAPAEHHRGC